MMKIEVVNNPVEDKVRAELRGELCKETIDVKIAEIGFTNIADYEREFIINNILNNPSEEDILNYCKEVKVVYFNTLCEETIVSGFTSYNGHVYRTNRDDQTNMIGQKDVLMEDPSINVVYWKTEDVGYVPHTREEWLTIYQEGFTHKQNTLFKYDMKKQECLKATNHLELESVKW